MRSALFSLVFLTLLVSFGGVLQADDSRPIAQPYEGVFEIGQPSYPVEREELRIPIDHLTLGVDHILDQQCYNGGFGWPHADCSATYHNITGPIILGGLAAYYFTMDGIDLAGALNGGAFDLTYRYDNGEARFSTFTPAFLEELARAADNTTFSDHVAAGFFDELAAGTYGPDDLTTAEWIANVQAGRSGTWVNLRPWEFHTVIPVSQVLGQPGQDALLAQAVLDGLNTLDNSDPDTVYSDIIGLAGAVRGLASARVYSFPAISAPVHSGVDGVDNLEDLAALLTSLQNPNGSWHWHSNLAAPATEDEDVQTTAYAVLALLAVDKLTAASSVDATRSGRNWMASLQLPDGGFPTYPGGDENTEVEAEALKAIADFDSTILVVGFETGTTDLWNVVSP
ncbi:MAG: hypothetical protein V2I67_03505 [Thermoanaerobaculales bacterium]|jgi:hypothetical protein|nr:hypothetical protein [Thermoanaerobaculales bacterium]